MYMKSRLNDQEIKCINELKYFKQYQIKVINLSYSLTESRRDVLEKMRISEELNETQEKLKKINRALSVLREDEKKILLTMCGKEFKRRSDAVRYLQKELYICRSGIYEGFYRAARDFSNALAVV